MTIFDAGVRADPYPAYEELRERGPIVHDPELGAFLVVGYEAARAILNDTDGWSSRVVRRNEAQGRAVAPGATMLNSDPPAHSRLRGVVGRVMGRQAMQDLEPAVRRIVRDCLPCPEDGPFDVVGEVAEQVPALVTTRLVGLPDADAPALKRWTDQVTVQEELHPGMGVDRELAGRSLAEYLAGVVRKRTLEPGDDAVSRMLVEADRLEVTENELVATLMLLLVAGFDTTTNLIGNAVLAFGSHSDQREIVLRDRSSLSVAVEEVLRYDAPTQATQRSSKRAITIEGVDIPEGSPVLVVVAAANRDPAFFDHPERFDINRPNAASHLGFGFGIHHCIGAPLARLEASVVLDELLESRPRFRLLDQELEYRPSYFLRGLSRLLID